jgi:hypothetical protein
LARPIGCSRVIQQEVLLGEVLEDNEHADDDAGRDTHEHEAGQDEEGSNGDNHHGVHGESRGQADAGLAASASDDGVEGDKVGDDRDLERDTPEELAVAAGLLVLLLVATVNRQLAASLPLFVDQTYTTAN